MSDECYVQLMEVNSLGSQHEVDRQRCKIKSVDRSVNQSLAKRNVAIGLVTCVIVFTTGAFLMSGLQTNVTTTSLDWKHGTQLQMDTRSVPSDIHNMSHNWKD